MQKSLFFLIVFFYVELFAQSYCIYVDEFYLNTQNKNKINTVLEDVSYPSWKVQENKVHLYSGEFKEYDDAQKMLQLMLLKYKDANIQTCEGTQKYVPGMDLFSIEGNLARKKINFSVPSLGQNKIKQKSSLSSYCLKMLDIPLSQTSKEKRKINYILKKFPDTRSKTINNRFMIISGEFTSLKSAQAVAEVLQEEFPSTIPVRCTQGTVKEYVEVTPVIQNYDDYNTNNLEVFNEKITQSQTQKNQINEILNTLPNTQTKALSTPILNKVNPVLVKQKSFSSPYCLKMLDIPLFQKRKEKRKINYILNNFPDTSSKVVNNRFVINSGEFTSLKSAQAVAKVLREEFPSTVAVRCTQETVRKINVEDKDKVKKFTNTPVIEEYVDVTPGVQHYDYFNTYSLEVFNEKITKSDTQKNKINKILNTLPDARTKEYNGKVSIVSGDFSSFDDAKTVAKVIEEDFPSVSIVSTSTKVKREPEVNREPNVSKNGYAIRSIKQTKSFKSNDFESNNNYLVDKKNTIKYVRNQRGYAPHGGFVSIFHLDNQGYISKKTQSHRDKNLLNRQEFSEEDFDLYESSTKNYLSGLYLKLNSAYDARNKNIAYDHRLEYDLFKEGYFEHQKDRQKQKIESRLKFYKVMKDIYSLNKDKEFLKIEKYTNSIVVSNLLLNLRFIEIFFSDAQKKLELGFITKYEYRQYQLVLRKVQNALYLHKKRTLLKIPKNVWVLLNGIERIQLVEPEKLLYMLTNNSMNVKFTETLQKKNTLVNKWTDRLKVNFYAGERKLYQSQRQLLVGIDAKIPLYNDNRQENNLKKIENTLKSNQSNYQFIKDQELLKVTLEKVLERQNKILMLQDEMVEIKRYVDELNVILESGFSSYVKIDYKTKQKAVRKYLNIYSAVQKERIYTYKEIVSILYLVQARSLEEITY